MAALAPPRRCWLSPELHPVPDLVKLRFHIERIEKDPLCWDQESWISEWGAELDEAPPQVRRRAAAADVTVPECGTAFCLAGHVVHDAGYVFARTFGDGSTQVALPGHPWEYVLTVAAKLLGVCEPQGRWLFNPHRTLPDFHAFLDREDVRAGACRHGDLLEIRELGQ